MFHSSSSVQMARTPLIKFIGKRSLVQNKVVVNNPGPSSSMSAAPSAPVKGSGKAVFLPAAFGRVPLTEAEIEYIESGGATKIW